ncbi:cation:proton antiporter [Streptomyces sp. NPDC018019]|uniref:cation:proton antiporter n=1 Tax=Streptomyces sp. NPDC018019 TaxID=3365030 RepID=UPI0037A37017
MDALTYVPAVVLVASVAPAVWLGRRAARLLGQPAIVGEIMACLLLGALLAGQFGWGGEATAGRPVLEKAGHLALALFVVGAVQEIRAGSGKLGGRAVAWTAAGSALLPMGCGTLLAVWVLAEGDPALRGSAPATAFVLMLAGALSVTAVPVLAGVLQDRGMLHTHTGRLAMAAAVSMDAVNWALLAVAVGLATGGGQVTPAVVFTAGLLLAWALRRLGGLPAARAWAHRVRPAVPAGLVVLTTVAAALVTDRLGLTDVLGAVLVALALPADGGTGPWTRAARTVGQCGRHGLPLLFVLTGAGLGSGPPGLFSWQATALGTALAVAGKLAGSYLGARAGGQDTPTSMRLAALLNTRGLTEITFLQIGYQADILTPALYLALVVMALVTTALAGPLLWAVDRGAPDTPEAAGKPLYPVER